MTEFGTGNHIGRVIGKIEGGGGEMEVKLAESWEVFQCRDQKDLDPQPIGGSHPHFMHHLLLSSS